MGRCKFGPRSVQVGVGSVRGLVRRSAVRGGGFFLHGMLRRRVVTPLAVERQEHEAEHVDVAVSSDVRMPIVHRIWWPCAKVSNRISSLLKKPASAGTPAMASDPIRNVQ